MRTTSGRLPLLVTGLVESATGFGLLVLPGILFAVLLGLDRTEAATIFMGRIAGAAMLAIGIASWLARSDTKTPAQRGLLVGVLIYNVVAAILLAYAGVILKMSGVLLWPAVAFHAVIAAWCFFASANLRREPQQ